ncbi:hypothetical protein [Candidatus Methylacidithermus pantelleriae]|uniref:Uncharacterized protein n=1 Tax=Candidatus Methylacidithermus pantelleriae TaxID=2744239 RepID=A0A8J2BRM0_9BACT|nr:hypothetical protein [Candidatus Methylacidithermus pantelleriae]CAF0692463.1 hypothetical protein MPNT_120026 [Candidatus Methylacidithermus pantelleriae]
MRAGRRIGRWNGGARFYVLGSKYETAAKQSCQATVSMDGSRSVAIAASGRMEDPEPIPGS